VRVLIDVLPSVTTVVIPLQIIAEHVIHLALCLADSPFGTWISGR